MPGAVNRYRRSSEGSAAVQARREREMLRRAVGTLVRELLYVAEALEQRLMLSGATDTAAKDKAVEFFNASSAVFVQNQGQWADSSIQYAFNGSGINIGFTDTGPVMDLFRAQEPESSAPAVVDPLADPRDSEPPTMDAARIRMSFDGAATVSPVGVDRSATSFNYLVGDASQHRSNVPGYTAVEYRGLWEGIDLKTWGKRNGLKYEFHVAPGADWRQIRVSYDGIVGLSIAADGSLHVATALGEIVEEAPVLYQEIDGQRSEVSGRFVRVDEDTYGFEVTGDFDNSRELVIDPDLAWATYLGGTDTDSSCDIAVDGSGDVYVAGWTESSGWAMAGAYDTTHNGIRPDVFVAKLSGTGASLLYCTYLGGTEVDFANGIAFDSSGNAYITGLTYSPSWATAGAYRTVLDDSGWSDAFVAKLNATGSSLLYCTYLGGSDEEWGRGIAVDGSGNAYVSGVTESPGLATTAAHDFTHNGNGDVFVAKLNTTGSKLLYFTYMGGSGEDRGRDIAVDGSGNAYVSGYTLSSGWARTGSYDTTYNGGTSYGDVFVAKLNATGSNLLYCTYLGGSSDDQGWDIAVDGSGNAYVMGATASSDWATAGAFDTTHGGSQDIFVARLNATGSSLLYCTYLGGSGNSNDGGIAVDGSGNAYVTGTTSSPGWATVGAYDTTYNGFYPGGDIFVAKLNVTGSNLLYCTYLGGDGYDWGYGIAVDGAGNVYVTGSTGSAGMATAGAYNTTHNGDYDAFVAKLSGLAEVVASPTITGIASDTGISGDHLTNDATLLLSGTSESGMRITVYRDGVQVGTTTADNSGWAFDYTGTTLGDGLYTFQATATNSLRLVSGFSPPLIVTVDTAAPSVVGGNFVYAAAPDRVMVQFSEDVSAYLEVTDLVVQPLPGGTAIVPVSVSFDGATNQATFAFASDLPNGDYRATLGAGAVADKAGNTLSAGLTLDFFALNGDANRDRTVGFDDLLLLAQNYNATGRTWATADFTGDGKVDFDDLLLLAQNYNATLPALPPDELAAPAAEASHAGPEGAVATSTALSTGTSVTTTTPDVAMSASVSNVVGDPAASAPDPAVILSAPAPTDAVITTIAPAASIPAPAVAPPATRSTFASTTKCAPAAVARSRRSVATPPALRFTASAHRAPATGVPLPQRFTFGDKPIRRKDDLLS